PRDAGGADLALLAHGAAQCAEVLVVDDVDLVPAERAGLPTPSGAGPLTAIAPARLLPAVATTLFCHLRRTPFERLEGDVVVPGVRARRRGLEVRRVGRNVALRRKTTAVLSAIPGAQELDRIGNDIHRLALVALLVLPFMAFQAS